MKVQEYWWTWEAFDKDKRAFYGEIIKKHDPGQQQWFIQFDSNNEDDAVLVNHYLIIINQPL